MIKQEELALEKKDKPEGVAFNRTEPLAVSLFCGAGGMDLGFKQAGFRIIVATDNWEAAIKTYAKNFPETKTILKDIRSLKIEDVLNVLKKSNYSRGDVDILIGGPPCEGFSRLNNNKLISLDMNVFKHPKSTLFGHMLRIANELRPKFVLMENVNDLTARRTADGDKVLDVMKTGFERIGYRAKWKIMNAQYFGVPQKRRRLFFLATNHPKLKISFPEKTHSKEGYLRLSDLKRSPKIRTVEQALEGIDWGMPNMERSRIRKVTKERMKYIPPGGYYKDLPDRLKTWKKVCDCKNKETCPHEPVIVKRYGTYLRRLDGSQPSFTITDNPLIHPFEDRYITIREKARIQTFPDNFLFLGSKMDQSKMIANAVPPLLAKKMAEHIIGLLKEYEKGDLSNVSKEYGVNNL